MSEVPAGIAEAGAAEPTSEDELDAVLAVAALPQRTITLCLRGNLVAEWEELEREFDQAAAAPTDGRLNARTGRTAEIARRMQQLREQMRAGTVTLLCRAQEPGEWENLFSQHPPRREGGKVIDADAMGVNTSTFFDALVLASVVTPQLTPQRWTTMRSKLTSRQFDDLWGLCWRLNRHEVSIPFSRAASRTAESSEDE